VLRAHGVTRVATRRHRWLRRFWTARTAGRGTNFSIGNRCYIDPAHVIGSDSSHLNIDRRTAHGICGEPAATTERELYRRAAETAATLVADTFGQHQQVAVVDLEHLPGRLVGQPVVNGAAGRQVVPPGPVVLWQPS
jgi:hypothetical protein